MDAFFEFARGNPGFATLMVIAVGCTIVGALNMPFRMYNRHLRSKNIAARGWPTNRLMDADGDIIHPEKDGE